MKENTPKKTSNLIFIFSDQHNRSTLGCYNNSCVKTPNLDRLSETGTRFENAYTPSPLCCPARASMITGLHVHQHKSWDNAFPFDGTIPGWAHALTEHGVLTQAIGKMHFRSESDDNGFTHETNTMHCVDGVGDVLGCMRHDTSLFDKRKGVLDAGIGESSYTRYDASNTKQACEWIRQHSNDSSPWALYLGLALPHPPNLVPEKYYRLYESKKLPYPPQARPELWPDHPAPAYVRKFFNFNAPVKEDELKNFLTAYYGACTYLDDQVGKILDAVDRNSIREKTIIVYSSDHGESLGARGIFGKFSMYDESAAVPLIVKGPGIPSGVSIQTPVSLVDLYPTFLEIFGIKHDTEQEQTSGESLLKIIESGNSDRTVLCQYHGPGTENAGFMLRNSRFKYIHFVNGPPQLFDMKNDPHEINDLAPLPECKDQIRFFEKKLRAILDPEQVNRTAKKEQKTRIEEAGGEKALREKGTFDNTPVPGEKPVYMKNTSQKDHRQATHTQTD